MAVQSAMNAAIAALRGAVGNDKKQKVTLNKIRDAFKAVEADEWPRSEMVERGMHLAEIISESVISLHKTRPRPTLAFCAAAASWLFETKLGPMLERGDEECSKAWEDIMFRGLMQPILNLIDSEDQGLEVVGSVLYQAVCEIMQSPWSRDFGGRFARSLALVLLSTCSPSSNKTMLLNPSIFGTDTLSKLIIDAKDYHYLDTLLELSFTMFSSQGGKVTRKAYADSIFSSGYALKRLPDNISHELANIHSVTNGGNSEKHVLDIMRTMSRAGIERQVFMTKDLSYCGMRITQIPPSNVIILDHEDLCVVFCDKNGESDVLTMATTTIRDIELTPQDASRIIVELLVAEQPLISSSREELAVPDVHIPGSPLKIRFSVSSSDVFGLEAALAARNLAGVLKCDNALTRNSSLVSTKISNAVSSIPLKKNHNQSNEQAEEMIRKYINLPSSGGSSPPPANRAKATARPVRPKPLPLEALVTSTTATRQATPPQTDILRDESPSVLRPVDKRTPQPLNPVSTRPAPAEPAGSTTTRAKRGAAEKSEKVMKIATLADMDGSELTDIDSGITPEDPGQKTVAKTPADDTTALPTPPRTRARAQQTKHVATTLVPATPPKGELPEVSSPQDAPSSSPKPANKRKLVEDNPFELPPLKPDRPAKQMKTEATKVPSSPQHTRPRNTTATRAKAKYGTTSKRMRVSSPIESIDSADSFEVRSPQKKEPATTVEKKREGTSAKNKTSTRMRPRPDKNDEPDVPKRQTPAEAAKAKPKSSSSVELTSITPQKDSDSKFATALKGRATEAVELPKKKRGRPPKNKPTQQPVKVPEPLSTAANAIEPASSQSQIQALDEAKPTRTDGKGMAEQTPVVTVNKTLVETQEEAPEDDDLLERLSQAAKKALRPPFVDNQPVISPHHSSSPMKTLDVEMEDPDVDVDTVEPLIQDLGTYTPKDIPRQVQDTTLKTVESANIHPIIQPPSVRPENKPKAASASTKEPMELLDMSKDTTSTSKPHVRVLHSPTRHQTPKGTQIDGVHDEGPVDIVETRKPAPTPPRQTGSVIKATRQHDLKPKPTVARIETRATAPQERKSAIPPEIPIQRQLVKPTERIQSEDATPRITPTARPIVKPQFRAAPTPVPAKAKHIAVTRVLFDTGNTQPSPKSALASPQRRTLPNGTRPSVSFLEPPIPLSRRGSSGSSTEGTQKQRAYSIDRENLTRGHSARTGDVILQIADILTEIQETITSNLGEKIQNVNTEARSARAELTKSVIDVLDGMKAESESHLNVLHEFESAFAKQAQAMLEGLGRVVRRSNRMNAGIENILSANARTGQSMGESILDFQMPQAFSMLPTS